MFTSLVPPRPSLRGLARVLAAILAPVLCLLATAAMLLFLNAGTAHALPGQHQPGAGGGKAAPT